MYFIRSSSCFDGISNNLKVFCIRHICQFINRQWSIGERHLIMEYASILEWCILIIQFIADCCRFVLSQWIVIIVMITWWLRLATFHCILLSLLHIKLDLPESFPCVECCYMWFCSTTMKSFSNIWMLIIWEAIIQLLNLLVSSCRMLLLFIEVW